MNFSSSEELELIREHSHRFLKLVFAKYSIDSLESAELVTRRPPLPLSPITIENHECLSSYEKTELSNQFNSDSAVAHFVLLNPPCYPYKIHPLHIISDQLSDSMGLGFPVSHPLENNKDLYARFGKIDGTTKIFSRHGRGGAQSTDSFALHQDGLGSCGTISAIALYMESAPLVGGYTYFQNICRIAIDLASYDYDAFMHLFAPDAITITRSIGYRALKVKSPVLFVNTLNMPQAALRVADAEYKVQWRDDSECSRAASRFFEEYTKPLSYGSSFVNLMARGQGCLNQNQIAAHGRTAYFQTSRNERVLSRKWFASTGEHMKFKHAPGTCIHPEFSSLYPHSTAPDLLTGEWQYNMDCDMNFQI